MRRPQHHSTNLVWYLANAKVFDALSSPAVRRLKRDVSKTSCGMILVDRATSEAALSIEFYQGRSMMDFIRSVCHVVPFRASGWSHHIRTLQE